MRSRLPTNIPYLHITFTLPQELRDLRLQYRKYGALNIIFEQAHTCIKDIFFQKFGCKVGIFSVIHTFGSYVNWNPHLHLVVTAGGFDDNQKRVSIPSKYIPFHAIRQQWRSKIIAERRKLINHCDPQAFEEKNIIFKQTFTKQRYVTISPPIFDVSKVMGYITRYMYRPPISLTNIIATHFTNNPHTSTITLKYSHKKPHKERTITYTIFDFLGLIARQLPDKYFRCVRYAGIFAPKQRKQYIPHIPTIPHTHSLQYPTILQRPSSYPERMIRAFQKNPYQCICGSSMVLISITYRSKKQHVFITKHIDSS